MVIFTESAGQPVCIVSPGQSHSENWQGPVWETLKNEIDYRAAVKRRTGIFT